MSIWTIVVRKRAFERRFREIVRRETERRSSGHLPLLTERLRNLSKGHGLTHPVSSGHASMPEPWLHSSSGATARDPPAGVLPTSRPITGGESSNISPHIMFAEHPREKATSTAVASGYATTRRHIASLDDEDVIKRDAATLRWCDYLSRDKVGRNGQFHDLTSEELLGRGGVVGDAAVEERTGRELSWVERGRGDGGVQDGQEHSRDEHDGGMRELENEGEFGESLG